MNKDERNNELSRLQLQGRLQLLKDDSGAALQTIKKGEAIKRGVVPPRVVSGGGGMLATAGQDATALYIGTGARAKDYRDLVAARKRITPAGAGGGGGGGSHPSSAGYYTNRPVHGDRGRGAVDVLRDAGDAATAAARRGVAGAGAAASSIYKRLKGKKKLSYREQVGEGIKHLEKARADAEAMKLLNDYQKAIARGLADAKAGMNVDMAQLDQMLTNAAQLKRDLHGAKTEDFGGGRRKSRKRRRRKRRKTRRRKRRRHTRRRRKSKRRKSRKKR